MSVSNAQMFPISQPANQETKLCIIIDSKMPIIMKVPISPHSLTLKQFKEIVSLQDDTYKFYFRSHDAEFGIVKEEIVDEDSNLPVDGDRIVVWVISADSNQSSLFEQAENSYDRLDGLPAMKINGNSTIEQHNDSQYILQSTDGTLCQGVSPIIVQFELDRFNFLGLTLVGPSDITGSPDRGIYVSEISAGSVVEQDGRIEVGDRILEINDFDVRNMRSDDAVALLRSCVNKRGMVTLELQRNPRLNQYHKGRFTLPREYAKCIHHHGAPKPVDANYLEHDIVISRFSHENQTPKVRKNMDHLINRGAYSLPRSVTPRSLYTSNNMDNSPTINVARLNGSTSVYEPSTPTLLRQLDVTLHCGKDDILTIYMALKRDSKSLNLKDRDWLKVVIKNAFLGSALVKWLGANVYGFSQKREVKQFANQMLGLGLIRNPMASKAFSEKCFYTLSD